MAITISGSGIVEANLADNAVTLAKMASGTDGEILTYDASGNPVAVSVGTDGQVLTSTGVGSPPAFEAAAAGGIVLSGSTANSGGSSSAGSAVILATLSSIDLSSYEGKRLVVHGSTAISEAANTGNTSQVALYLVVGSTQVILSTSMQGAGVHGSFSGNEIEFMATSAVYTITSAMAGTATLTLRGGIDSGNFYYGDQPNYGSFTIGGVNLNYFVA